MSHIGEKGKILSLSNEDLLETLQKNNPELLKSALSKIEEGLREESEGACFVPAKAKEFENLCVELREIVSTLEGEVIAITPIGRKCLRHYIDVCIPDGAIMDTETFQRFLECLKHFNYCHWSIEDGDDLITLGLSFSGIYQK